MTGFDIERILRREGAPKAFAKAVAAACRTAGLFDRRQSDEEQKIQDVIDAVERMIESIRG